MSTPIGIFKKLVDCIRTGDSREFDTILQKNKNFDINIKYNKKFLIHLAVEEYQPGIMKMLIARGANLNIQDSTDGNTPLHLAARESRPDILRMLLSSKAADINIKNKRDETPMQVAFSKNRLDVGKVLLKRKSDGSFENIIDIDDVFRTKIMKVEAWKKLIGESVKSQQTKVTGTEYNVTDGAVSALIGHEYQILMLTFICMRAEKLYSDFEVRPEWIAAGKFDDVVLNYKMKTSDPWYYRFIQIKHKDSANPEKNKINLNVLKLNGSDFELTKYFESVAKIKKDESFKDGNLVDFIICTTATIDESAKDLFSENEQRFRNDGLLFFGDDNEFKGKLHNLNKEKLSIIVDWNPVQLIPAGDVDDVFKKVFFITAYPNQRDLSTRVLQEIGKSFCINKAGFIKNSLVDAIKKHYMHFIGKPITQTTVKEYLKAISGHLSLQHCLALTKNKLTEISSYEIDFNTRHSDLPSFLKANDVRKLLQIPTKHVELATISVLNELKSKLKNLDDFVVIDSNMWLNKETQEIVLEALRYSKETICVLVQSKSQETQAEIEDAYRRIHDNSPETKIISIESNSTDCHNEDEKILFKNLNDSSKIKIMKKEISFQGQNKKLKDLISTDEADEIINPAGLLGLIKRRKLEIAKEKPNSMAIPNSTHYVERILTKRNDNKDEEEKLEDQLKPLKQYKEDDFVGANISQIGRTVAVQGEPGLGKSTLMQSLKVKMQTKGYCVAFINLNDVTLEKKDPFHLSKLDINGNDPEIPLHFLLEILKSIFDCQDGITLHLFEWCLMSGKPLEHLQFIILFDGFDEISPNYEKEVFCLVEALQRTNVWQMWITTRPHESEKISDKLKSTNYNLTPFNSQNQLDFLLKNCRALAKKDFALVIKENLLILFSVIITEMVTGFEEHRTELLKLLRLEEKHEILPNFDKSTARNFSNFIVNPLQFKMLFDLCLKNIAIEKMSLNRIYKEFINSKFKIFFEAKVSMSSTSAAEEVKDGTRDNYIATHYIFAYQTLFPEHCANDDRVDQKNLDRAARAGFIKKQGDKFTHRSFAEYFAAIHIMRENKLNAIIEVLLQDKRNLISTFINDQLRESTDDRLKFTRLPDGELFQKVNAKKENCIHVAARRGHLEIITKFLKRLLDESTFRSLISESAAGGETVLDKASLAKEYFELFEEFQGILDESSFKNLLMRSRVYDARILKTAAETGDYEKLLRFLEKFHPNKPINDFLISCIRRGHCIAHMAVLEGTFTLFTEVMAPKIDKKALQEILLSVDNTQETILHKAAELGTFRRLMPFLQTELVEEDLIELCKKPARNGGTILNKAAYSGHFKETVRYVFEPLGKDDFQKLALRKNTEGWNCLHSASMAGNCADVISFYNQNQFDALELMKACTNHGSTVLHIAANHHGFLAAAELLHENLPTPDFMDLITKQDDSKCLCLHNAADVGRSNEVIWFLKKYFPKFDFNEFLCTSDDEGNTILHIAADYGDFSKVANLVLKHLGKENFKNLMSRRHKSNSSCFDFAKKSAKNKNDFLAFLNKHFAQSEINAFLV